jgi:hypothetical protein
MRVIFTPAVNAHSILPICAPSGQIEAVFRRQYVEGLSKNRQFPPVFGARKRYTIFHKFFFISLETACANPNLDGDMSKHHVAVTAVLVALAASVLSACGPDDGASVSASQSSAANNAAVNVAANTPADTARLPPTPSGASASLTNASNAAPDTAVQSVEASLAADSQQVTPVLHYAPGDKDPGGPSSTSN